VHQRLAEAPGRDKEIDVAVATHRQMDGATSREDGSQAADALVVFGITGAFGQ
jgi:hypothetical protein